MKLAISLALTFALIALGVGLLTSAIGLGSGTLKLALYGGAVVLGGAALLGAWRSRRQRASEHQS